MKPELNNDYRLGVVNFNKLLMLIETTVSHLCSPEI